MKTILYFLLVIIMASCTIVEYDRGAYFGYNNNPTAVVVEYVPIYTYPQIMPLYPIYVSPTYNYSPRRPIVITHRKPKVNSLPSRRSTGRGRR